MTPIQQLMLGAGGAKKKTYMDDVFSTYLYKGTNGANTLTTGLDMSGEGGLTWIKGRSSTTDHTLFDTVRGVNKKLRTDSTEAESTLSAGQTFTSTGFTLNNTFTDINDHNVTYSSWSFRKAPGFFDVVTWTGNSDTNQTISHSLSSIPGMIIAKRTDSSTTGDWVVYHRDHEGYLRLNTTQAAVNDSGAWTPVTSTSFKAYDYINVNGASYVAYVFAGGESDAATARSVDFDGSDDRLSIPDNDAWDLGTGDFTLECWVKGSQSHSSYVTICGSYGGAYKFMIRWSSPDVGTGWSFFPGSAVSSTKVFGQAINDNQWHHLAVVRNGTKISTYTDGILNNSITSSGTFNDSAANFEIGHRDNGEHFNGNISNVRLVKGTAVYTSSFRVPQKPLENITNTVLLCCNNSSATGATVTPGTITANSSPTASTDSPFDDPSGFVFGDAGDQNVIKCGSYTGNGSATGPEINLGFEPQWVMVKRTDSGGTSWVMLDTMRAWTAEGEVDAYMYANKNDAESTHQWGAPTSTGMQMDGTDGTTNASGGSYIYLAIRRPDGYVGKLPELGTNVFAMDTGSSSSTIPEWDSGFPVDFGIYKTTGSAQNWHVGARLIQAKGLYTNTNDDEDGLGDNVFDSNVGWGKSAAGTYGSGYQSWMWKRHAGLDVVTFAGNATSGRQLPHSLNAVPEMMWVKNRDRAESWYVYHKDNGTNPKNRALNLNTSGTSQTGTFIWNDTLPTSTHFTVGNDFSTNGNGDDMFALLFASVAGISKVGYYDGTGSDQTISLGFTPRFLIFKCSTNNRDWHVFDSTRGINGSSGNDPALRFNSSDAQYSGENYIEPATNGILVKGSSVAVNENNHKYIYYAHA